MLNSKQRANLRSLASVIEPKVIVGKEGLSDEVIGSISKVLSADEIVKVSVLDSSEMSAKECLFVAADKLLAEQVCQIGKKFVLYKKSDKKGIKHIQF